jgi:hypothetical protein
MENSHQSPQKTRLARAGFLLPAIFRENANDCQAINN